MTEMCKRKECSKEVDGTDIGRGVYCKEHGSDMHTKIASGLCHCGKPAIVPRYSVKLCVECAQRYTAAMGEN